ncbi:hypothetical protein EH165_01045 [Nakamurella antarctica]|uniref:YiaAB two helix domain-containing protein n=1 Tax=Nakamurella antarctica TaxID=1902245 RepID=A0A3G8ZJE8_9ACTN|nr:hypothetical protein [Nakamurella antarctica]AZI56965.1 hypothetical protein EH165_01045 [Nakamurella antarctica]
MSTPKVAAKNTSAFFGASIAFLGLTGIWNIGNLWMLNITVQDRYTIGMGIIASMFAVVVVSKVVRDKEDANDFVNGIRQARYEEVLANAPAPGLGQTY